jgi:hypothetical protein
MRNRASRADYRRVPEGLTNGERVLRPSLVRVSSGPLPQPEPEPVRPAPEQEAGAETPNSDKQA